MLETIVKIPKQLKKLNDSLKTLSEQPSFEQAQIVVNNVTSLLSISVSDAWKPFNDSQGKIRSNAGWFMLAEGFADKRAAYKLADNNPQSIDLKCYWMKKINKSVISWLVALTPNFEDEPFYGNLNVGIDFIIPDEANRILVVLSKNYVIRSVELQDFLSVTQQEIFNAWFTDFDYSNKAQFHEILWKSFDLEPVNKSFYKGISAFFVELKQFLAEDVKVFDDKHAAYFTNRLIGRIVFCWFLDKKGIINPDVRYFDVGSLTASEYYHLKLETLFFKVLNTPIEDRDTSDNDPQKKMFPELVERNIFNIDVDFKTPFLNGGLFEIKDSDKFENSDLVFPNDYFDRLFQFLKHYNFTTDESTSMFQQVAIDPEMLGRIFENLLAEQVEETGEQARKAKGAFYTPREIVDYMCQKSLREYIKTKISDDDLRDQCIGLLLDVKPHEFRDQQRNYRSDLKPYKYDILKALDEIKIIDPACGSGAFPMGMLQLLLDIYDRVDATFDPYKKKIEIIKNNLFGVDIEPMAVEICRLRAWLSIVVDEDEQSRKIEPLPNLDFKFICANTLIPLASEDSRSSYDTIDQKELVFVREKYFNARTRKSKGKWHRKYEQIIGYKKTGNMFHSDRENQLRSYHPFNSENKTEFFNSEFMFGVERFDIVISNPPWVSLMGKHALEENKKNANKLKELYTGNTYMPNLFEFFINRSMNLLSRDGSLVFIVPDRLGINKSCSYLRKKILDEARIVELIYHWDFAGIIADTMTLVFQNSSKSEDFKVPIKHNPECDAIYSTHNELKSNNNYVWKSYIDDKIKKCVHKIKRDSTRLDNYCRTTSGFGGKSNLITENRKNTKQVEIIKGKSIDRYVIKKKYYFEFLQENITGRTRDMKKLLWKEKVLLRKTGNRLIATYDDSAMLPEQSLYFTYDYKNNLSPKYLLGLLNSKLLTWFYLNELVTNIDSTPQLKNYDLDSMPIKMGTQREKEGIEGLVNKIIQLRKNNFNSNTLEMEDQIDDLVFDLYGLTDEERKIVLSGS